MYSILSLLINDFHLHPIFSLGILTTIESNQKDDESMEYF
jgi:hypothetical protein